MRLIENAMAMPVSRTVEGILAACDIVEKAKFSHLSYC
jgi:hypothetical protein